MADVIVVVLAWVAAVYFACWVGYTDGGRRFSGWVDRLLVVVALGYIAVFAVLAVAGVLR